MAVSKTFHAAYTKAQDVAKKLFTSGPNPGVQIRDLGTYSTIPGVGKPMNQRPQVAGVSGPNPSTPFKSTLPKLGPNQAYGTPLNTK